MSCCGNKRRLLSQSQSQMTPIHNSQIFKYIGNASLFITGAVTRQIYRFSHPGEKIEVAVEDASALLSEKDLRPEPNMGI